MQNLHYNQQKKSKNTMIRAHLSIIRENRVVAIIHSNIQAKISFKKLKITKTLLTILSLYLIEVKVKED